MDYTKLKIEVKEISEIANSVPEQFRDKCFEILLNRLFAKEPKALNEVQSPPASTPAANGEGIPSLKITTQLRLLMSRTGLKEEELNKFVMCADYDVHFIKEPAGMKIAEGQISWALLLALKNCILNDSLTVDPETVRSFCQDKGYYNNANFAKNFKNQKYSKLFKGLMEPQGEAQALTTDGEKELAALIRKLGSAS